MHKMFSFFYVVPSLGWYGWFILGRLIPNLFQKYQNLSQHFEKFDFKYSSQDSYFQNQIKKRRSTLCKLLPTWNAAPISPD